MPTKRKKLNNVLNAAIVAAAVLIITAGVAVAQLAPEKRFTVYNGVISIEGQADTNDIMQLGNAGRDISSTGRIFIRPGTADGGYDDGGTSPSASGTFFVGKAGGVQDLHLTGQFCFGAGSGDCRNTWAAAGGTLDQAYRAGVGPDYGRIINVDTGVGSVELRGTGRIPLVLQTDQNDQLQFYKTGSPVPNSAPHTLVDRSNVGFRFWDGNGSGPAAGTLLTLTPRDGTTMNNRIGVGLDNPASKFVINYNTTNTGGDDNALSVIAAAVGPGGLYGSAIYAQQNTAAGYAGYFSGQVRVEGAPLTVNNGSVIITGAPGALTVRGKTSLLGGWTNGFQIGSDVTLLGGYSIRSIEAESSFVPVVGPTPAACFQDNYVTGSNTYLRLNNCDTSTALETSSFVTLPAGNWRVVFRIRKVNTTNNSATTDNFLIAATDIGGASRHLTEHELDWRFTSDPVPHTYSIRLALTTLTSFRLKMIPEIVSDFLIDNIHIVPDNDSFSVVGDHSLTSSYSSSGSAVYTDGVNMLFNTGSTYTCRPGAVMVGVRIVKIASSPDRYIVEPVCSRN